MTPYREPPQTPRVRWWQRLACVLGRHEWSPVEYRYRFGVYRPCVRCDAALVGVPAVPQLGQWVERLPLEPAEEVSR